MKNKPKTNEELAVGCLFGHSGDVKKVKIGKKKSDAITDFLKAFGLVEKDTK